LVNKASWGYWGHSQWLPEMLPGESKKLCEVPIRDRVEVKRGRLGSRYWLFEVNWGQSKFFEVNWGQSKFFEVIFDS